MSPVSTALAVGMLLSAWAFFLSFRSSRLTDLEADGLGRYGGTTLYAALATAGSGFTLPLAKTHDLLAVVLLVWLVAGLAVTGAKIIAGERMLLRASGFEARAVAIVVGSKWTAVQLNFASVLAALAWYDPLYTSLALLTLAATPGIVLALVANSLCKLHVTTDNER